MSKSFNRTLGILNSLIKPGIPILKDSAKNNGNKAHALSAETLGVTAFLYDNIIDAMNNDQRKVALFEHGLTPQLFYAFDSAPLCMETYPMFFSSTDNNVIHEFLDATQQTGISQDICSTDRFILGAGLCGELPENSYIVATTSPCDGTRLIYPLLQKIMKTPACYLEAPFSYERVAAQWFGGQIKSDLIPFLEKVTGIRFDEDKFREIIEESNRSFELLVDIHDMYTTKPVPHKFAFRLFPSVSYVQQAGIPQLTRTLEMLRDDAADRFKNKSPQSKYEEKYRVLWGHVPPFYAQGLFNWMEKELGACVVMKNDMTDMVEPIDTASLDTMLTGYALQGLNMTMSMMRVDAMENARQIIYAHKRFQCDCVILTQHVGCNSYCGASGILREELKKRNIPALYIDLDYNDNRILPDEQLKEKIETFFSTVMA